MADASAPALSLRILLDGSERTVSLGPGKCTVGSSSHCQLRLVGPQVRPLHCLIVQEGGAATVTRWAPDALLNDQEFTSSAFVPGDCLRIGNVQVFLVAQDQTSIEKPPADSSEDRLVAEPAVAKAEVVKEAFTAPQTEKSVTSVRKVVKKTPRRTMNSASTLESDRLVRQLWSANFGARQRCRNLLRTLRDARVEVSSFDQQIDMLQGELRKALEERGEITSELNRLSSESNQRESQATQEMDRLISELNDAYESSSNAALIAAQHEEQESQLRVELEILHTEHEQLRQSQAANQKRQHDLEQALACHEQSVAELEGELTKAQAATETIQAHDDERAAFVDQLRGELQTSQAERGEIQEALAEFQRHQPELEATLAERDEQIGELHHELEQVHSVVLLTEERSAEKNACFQDLQLTLLNAEQERDQLLKTQTEFQESQSDSEESLHERDDRITQLQRELEEVRQAAESATQSHTEQSAHGEQLQAEVERLQAMREQLANKGEEHQKRVFELEQLLEERDSHTQHLHGELQQAQANIASADQRVVEQTANGEQLQAELEHLRGEHEQLANKDSELQHRIGELAHWLGERDDQIGQLQHALSQAEATNASAEESATEQIARLEQLQSELTQLQEEREQLGASQVEHQQQEQQWEEGLATREECEQELRNEIGQLLASRDELGVQQAADLESYQHDLAELNQQRDQMLAEHSEHQQQWEQSLAERDRCLEENQVEHQQVCEALQLFQLGASDQTATCQRLEKELAEACEQRDEMAGQHPEWESQVRDLQETLGNRDQHVTELSEELATIGQRRGEVEAELEQRRVAAEQLESEVAELRQQRESLSNQLEASTPDLQEQSELEKLLQQLDTTQRESEGFESELSERTAECGRLEREQGELEIRCQQLAAGHAAETSRYQDLEKDLAERQQSFEQAESNLQAAHTELQQSVDQIQQLEEKCNAAESKLASLEGSLESQDNGSGETSLADSSLQQETLQQEYDELAKTLAAAREELESLREQIANSQNDSEVDAQSVEGQSDAIDQLSSELDCAREELAVEHSQREQVHQLYQQSQKDLVELRDCLLLAETTLRDQTVALESYQSQEPVVEEDSTEDVVEDIAEKVFTSEEDTGAEAALARLRELAVWADKGKTSDGTEVEEVIKEEFTPASFIDQYDGDFEEDKTTSSSTEETQRTVVQSEPDGLDDESDDAALEAYMQNMMKRVRGDNGDEQVSAPLPKAEDTTNENPLETVDIMVERVASVSDVNVDLGIDLESPLDLESLRNTSRKPVLPTDLAAMRELANSSARSAIAKHNNQNFVQVGFSRFLICVIATGVAAYVLLTANDLLSLRSIGGWVACVVGMIWGCRVIVLLLETIRTGSQRHEIPDEISVDEEPLPIGGVE